MRWAGNVARMGETRNAYRILVGEPEGKTPLGRPTLGAPFGQSGRCGGGNVAYRAVAM
jgi:hypothetical protein